MWVDIRRKRSEMAKRYVATQRHTIQVDWTPFMDEIAEQIGCRPRIRELLNYSHSVILYNCNVTDNILYDN
jgi:dimethylaniline monooxygenase (N-oxide forming)